MTEIKKLYRSNDKILGGVCGGLGEYLGVDPTFIRIIWCFLALFYGIGVLAYLICWVIIPEKTQK